MPLRSVLWIGLLICLPLGACSDDDVENGAAADPSCWDLVGQTIDQGPNYGCTTGTDTRIGHGFHTVTCEAGPDLAFIGGQHDPILLYGRVGQKWQRYEGTADFPETSGEPYRTCRPSEPPCRGDVPPTSPDGCPH